MADTRGSASFAASKRMTWAIFRCIVAMVAAAAWCEQPCDGISSTAGPAVDPMVEVVTVRGHARGVNRAAFFPGGSKIATSGHDGEIHIWDVGHSSLVGLYRAHSARVNRIDVSPSGRRFASGDVDGNVLLWTLGNPRPRCLYTHSTSVDELAFATEDHLVSLALESRQGRMPVADLVDHHLDSGTSSPSDDLEHVTLIASSSRQPGRQVTFLGTRYMLVWEEGQPAGSLLDLAGRAPIGQYALRENARPHLISETEVVTAYPDSLVAYDFSRGDVFDWTWDMRSRAYDLAVLATDETSRRIAYLTDIWALHVHAAAGDEVPNKGNGLAVSTLAPLSVFASDEFAQLGSRNERDSGRLSFYGVDDLPGGSVLAFSGAIAALTLEGGDARQLAGAPGGSRASIEMVVGDDASGSSLPAPDVMSSPFTVAHNLAWSQGASVLEGGQTVQPLIVEESSTHHCGSDGACKGYHERGGMSPSGRFAFASLDVDNTRLWLFHSQEDLDVALERLTKRGFPSASQQAAGDDAAPTDESKVEGEPDCWSHCTAPEARSLSAVADYQSSIGLSATGVLDGATRRELAMVGALADPNEAEGKWLEYRLPKTFANSFPSAGVAFSPDETELAFGVSNEIRILSLDDGSYYDVQLDASSPLVALGYSGVDELVAVYQKSFILLDAEKKVRSVTRAHGLGAIAGARSYGSGNVLELYNDVMAVVFVRPSVGCDYSEALRIRTWEGEREWIATSPRGFFAGTPKEGGVSVRLGATVMDLAPFHTALHQPEIVREAISIAGDCVVSETRIGSGG